MSELDAKTQARLARSVKVANNLEREWEKKFQNIFDHYAELVMDAVRRGDEVPPKFDFESALVTHAFDVQSEGFKFAELEIAPEDRVKLARKPPKSDRPRSLRQLFDWWELWRKKKKVPKRQRALADGLKKLYFSKLQEVWRQHAKDFLSGNAASLDDVREAIQEATKTTYNRAKLIVDTETTNYFNRSRRDVYDQAEGITHYLFLAIRDSATTAWCTDEIRNGKRGRSGLVYTKGTKILDKETPACHWRCRSEIVPLSIDNPSHRRLINNQSLRRENHKCTPLPKGWGSR